MLSKEKEAVEEMLEVFDFHKVHALFSLMGWEYFDGVPNVARLQDTARNLLNTAIKRSNQTGTTEWIASGHFRATFRPRDNELQLELIYSDKSVFIQ